MSSQTYRGKDFDLVPETTLTQYCYVRNSRNVLELIQRLYKGVK